MLFGEGAPMPSSVAPALTTVMAEPAWLAVGRRTIPTTPATPSSTCPNPLIASASRPPPTVGPAAPNWLFTDAITGSGDRKLNGRGVTPVWRRFDIVEAPLSAARVQEISADIRRLRSRRRRPVTAADLTAAVETLLAAVDWTDPAASSVGRGPVHSVVNKADRARLTGTSGPCWRQGH